MKTLLLFLLFVGHIIAAPAPFLNWQQGFVYHVVMVTDQTSVTPVEMELDAVKITIEKSDGELIRFKANKDCDLYLDDVKKFPADIFASWKVRNGKDWGIKLKILNNKVVEVRIKVEK